MTSAKSSLSAAAQAGGLRMWLCLGGGIAALIAVAVALYAALATPRVVVEGARIGRTVMFPEEFAPVVSEAQAALDSTAFLGDVKQACMQDEELVRTWTPENTCFKLRVPPRDGRVHLYCQVPSYSTRYFKLSELTEYHGGDDCPEVSREVEERNERMTTAVVGTVRKRLEELMEQRRQAEGASP